MPVETEKRYYGGLVVVVAAAIAAVAGGEGEGGRGMRVCVIITTPLCEVDRLTLKYITNSINSSVSSTRKRRMTRG